MAGHEYGLTEPRVPTPTPDSLGELGVGQLVLLRELDAFAAAREAGLHISASQVVAYDRARSLQVFDAIGANVAAYAASGNVAELRFSDLQREQAGDKHTRRYLDPDPDPNAQSGKPASPKKGAARMSRKKSETTRSSVDDFDLV